MLIPYLHGLKFKHNSVSSIFNFKTVLATDAKDAPIGKSTGSYLIDSNSQLASIQTVNLPNLSGYLKQVRIDFDLERVSSARGDFVVATAHPSFPNNLGTPVIDQIYIDALDGRKFICDNFSGTWSSWREIRNDNSLSFYKVADSAGTVQVDIDPVTLRNYYVELNPGAKINVKLFNSASKYFTDVNLDLNIVSSNYTVTWPVEVLWANDTNTPPAALPSSSRLNVSLKKTRDNKIFGSFKVFKG